MTTTYQLRMTRSAYSEMRISEDSSELRFWDTARKSTDRLRRVRRWIVAVSNEYPGPRAASHQFRRRWHRRAAVPGAGGRFGAERDHRPLCLRAAAAATRSAGEDRVGGLRAVGQLPGGRGADLRREAGSREGGDPAPGGSGGARLRHLPALQRPARVGPGLELDGDGDADRPAEGPPQPGSDRLRDRPAL